MTDSHAGLEFESTSLAGGLPPDPERLGAARAVRLSPDLRAAFLAPGAARENLDRLFQGALCVTTGQQPGLFTGPLYSVHKALTAVALARALSARLGHPVVPVFWVAGDDHDFSEGNHTHVLSASQEVQRLLLRERDAAAPSTPLYQEPVGSEIAGLFDTLRAILPETEFRPAVLEWLERHYRPEADLATAYANALSELLAPTGLIVFLPTHAAAKRAMTPWLLRALEQAGPLQDALAQRAKELQAAGREAPVAVGDGATMVMVEGRLGRDRLLMDGGGFVSRRAGERWSAAELERLAADQAQRLSPNVLARPAIEAAILPTIAYVGGPGELAYLPQAAPVYRVLGVPAQAAVPRWSGRVLEPRVRKVLEKYRLAVDDLNQPEGKLEASLVAEGLPAAARDAIAALRAAHTNEYPRLTEAAAAVDPTLRKPVESAKNAALGGLAEIEKRMVGHLKKQNEILLQQVDKARRNVFPLGSPQERVFNIMSFTVRYGNALVDGVLAACAAHAAALESLFPQA